MPIAIVSQLVDLVGRWHVSASELLSPAGLREDVVEDPLGRLPVTTIAFLLERARTLTGEPGLGYYLGLKKGLSVYGYLGFAALHASTLREALTLAVKFAPLVSSAFSIELSVEGSVAALNLEERADMGSARDIQLISLMFGLRTVAAALTGKTHPGTADLAIPEPSYNARFVHLAPNWRFGQRFNRVLLGAASLDLPIVTSDPTGLRIARTLCERALNEAGIDAGLSVQVRDVISRHEHGLLSLGDAAKRLHLSERTLKRKLAAEGVTYSMLVERARRERALLLLRVSRLSIQEIAERLGYSGMSTFIRAFRRWTGIPPSVYRRSRWKTRSAGSAGG